MDNDLLISMSYFELIVEAKRHLDESHSLAVKRLILMVVQERAECIHEEILLVLVR